MIGEIRQRDEDRTKMMPVTYSLRFKNLSVMGDAK